MLSFLSLYFNSYNRKARLQPALMSVLSIIVVCILSIPEFRTIWAAISGIVIYGGASTMLTQIGRDRGKALEQKLFQSWGGKPSTAMLRYRDARLTRSTKDRYRAFLARAVPGLKLASPEDEHRSPLEADAGYEDATAWLLAQTSDRARFGLLFQENINYGFRRNTWALKPLALLVDAGDHRYSLGSRIKILDGRPRHDDFSGRYGTLGEHGAGNLASTFYSHS